MNSGVKYLLETATYKRQGLWAGRGGFKAMHCKQKEIRGFHVEQFLFVLDKSQKKNGFLLSENDRQTKFTDSRLREE
jgi:hypothetical protein